jgi:hypothetical protein
LAIQKTHLTACSTWPSSPSANQWSFTHDQFLEKNRENENVSAYSVTAADMKDNNKFFDVLCGDFKDVKTLKWQVFFCL